MKKGKAHRHTYRKAGIGWDVISLMEWRQLPSNPEPQCVHYLHQEGERLARLSGGLCTEQSQVAVIQEETTPAASF